MKKTLVHLGCTDFQPAWMLGRWLRAFDVVTFDPTACYDPITTVVWVDYLDRRDWYQPLVNQGLRLIKHYHWDSYEDEHTQVIDGCLHLRPHHYPWIHEHSMYTHLGYEQQVQPRNPDRFFLLLMHLRRDIRDQLLAAVDPWLTDSLYSYVGRGVHIAGDSANNGPNWQRYFNPAWYSATNFSLVAETTNVDRLFVSEKSFKPLAFQHPMIIYGTPGTLGYLHSLGFETFDHCIDESYDAVTDPIKRQQAVVTVMADLYNSHRHGQQLFADPESRAKIQHNFQLFYDTQRVDQLWQTELINPVREFVNG
jgi:hypothetical protein